MVEFDSRAYGAGTLPGCQTRLGQAPDASTEQFGALTQKAKASASHHRADGGMGCAALIRAAHLWRGRSRPRAQPSRCDWPARQWFGSGPPGCSELRGHLAFSRSQRRGTCYPIRQFIDLSPGKLLRLCLFSVLILGLRRRSCPMCAGPLTVANVGAYLKLLLKLLGAFQNRRPIPPDAYMDVLFHIHFLDQKLASL